MIRKELSILMANNSSGVETGEVRPYRKVIIKLTKKQMGKLNIQGCERICETWFPETQPQIGI